MTPALKTAPTPEALGFSSERLARIRPAMQAYVDSGKFAGISTLLARRGQIIYFEQFGARDKVTQAPWRPTPSSASTP